MQRTLRGELAGQRVLESLQDHVEYMSAPRDPANDSARVVLEDGTEMPLGLWQQQQACWVTPISSVSYQEISNQSLESTVDFWHRCAREALPSQITPKSLRSRPKCTPLQSQPL